jgi:hypothetical protein
MQKRLTVWFCAAIFLVGCVAKQNTVKADPPKDDESSVAAATAPVLDTAPLNICFDFEDGKDAVVDWVSNGKYVVNFKGVTEEKAFAGKKSYKLDVTFQEGSYFYWSLPVNIPAEGKLRASARLLVADGTTGKAGVGVNYAYPPTEHSGCGVFAQNKLETTGGEWVEVGEDLVARADTGSARIASTYLALATGENLGRVVDRIGFFLYGKKGDRVVLYVDDIRLEGETPSSAEYAQTITRRWEPVKQKIAQTISDLRGTLDTSRKELESLQIQSPTAKAISASFSQYVPKMEAILAAAEKKGVLAPHEYNYFKLSAERIKTAAATVKELDASGISFNDVILYALENPNIDLRILPQEKYVAARVAAGMKMIAARGEFESASVVVQALRELKGVKVSVGDLVHEAGDAIIPGDNLDLRVVKCWYQAGSAWVGIGQDSNRRILTPELLLHDDSLVKVDYEQQKNFLKLAFREGDKYWDTEDPAYKKERGPTILSVEDFPVRDAKTLQPADIDKDTVKQYWLTLRVPDNAKAGFYNTEIRVMEGEQELGKIALKVRVLPFSLPMPKTYYSTENEFISSIYYRARMDLEKYPYGTISSEQKSEQQLRAELRDMYEHNIYNPTSYQSFNGLSTYLRLRDECGMKGMTLLSLGAGIGNPDTPEGLAEVTGKVKRMQAIVRQFGIEDLYLYGIDEATGDKLLSQRKVWQAVHEAGAKMFVAGAKGNFEHIGDLLDMQIQAYEPSREEARMWHEAGQKILCYANPQTGPENPEVFRRNFGLYLWKMNYDGAMTYAYQHSFGNIYDDFDHSQYREHVFSYPTADGVIPTLAIEGYREGIDDIRYGTLLKMLIEKHKDSGGAKGEAAHKAAEYLEGLDTTRDLEAVRLEIIDLILSLHE